MYNIKNLIIITLCYPIFSSAQQDTIPVSRQIEEVKINAINAVETTPVSFTNISEDEIEKNNLGQDLPYLISLTPSIISSSDAGAGIGYTYMSIRGSDASRINVTINGIPINDSESQGVWWVNMPDFSSSVSNIQIQRGVGTSTNGVSAFGASINLNTNGLKRHQYLSSSISIGSYNTLKNNVEFGTGLINKKWAFDGRLSRIASDGYIDRSSSDLKSIYLQGGYYGETESLKAIIFSGNERTYQSWYGVPKKYLDSIRTFNPYNYENEVDNYEQSHFQLHYNKMFEDKLFINLAAHYTKGSGFYEQYIGTEHNSILYNGEYVWGQNEFSFYGLDNVIVNNDTLATGNFIRRKWLDNDFYGLTFSAIYKSKNANFTFGGAKNQYLGRHFGEVIKSQYYENISEENPHEYYGNDATKDDQNIYLKTDYGITKKINLFVDLQTRNLKYNFEGLTNEGTIAEQSISLNFFNPKVGIFFDVNKSAFYASYAIANKEPNRNDYIESSPSSRPKHETLYDTEVGWKFHNKNISVAINLYYMDYNNQLINTGEINDVGYSVHSNIKDSYRKGIEIISAIKVNDNLNWNVNLSFSENKISEHNEYIDNWDTGEKEIIEHQNRDIAFSPSIIGSSQLNYKYKNLSTSWILKHVGDQYIDNTSSNDRMLDRYSINNLLISYHLKFKNIKQSRITLAINNLFDHKYSNRAWVYRFNSTSNIEDFSYDPYINKDNDGYNMTGYFPQAARNYMLGLTLGF